MRLRGVGASLAVTMIVVAVTATLAVAARPPTAADVRAFMRAADRAKLIPRDHGHLCSMNDIRVSTVDSSWAAGNLACKNLDRGAVLFEKSPTWHVAEVDGYDHVGCGVVAWPVLRDLGLLASWGTFGENHPGAEEAKCKGEQAQLRKAEEWRRSCAEQGGTLEDMPAESVGDNPAATGQISVTACKKADGTLEQEP
jgi:hypothetical protein